MTITFRQLAAAALGYVGSLSGQGLSGDQSSVASIPSDLSDGFFDGQTPQPPVDGRPPQIGFRRPQQSERVKRDCLANGTNFCFGDSNNYCSSCGTCCSAASDGNNKWCCPSGSICCGSSCCGSGQTCSNGKCYLPVVIVTETSSMSVTLTHVVTNIATIIQKVVETSIVYSTVDVTNTNAETQTNWFYVTATTVGKRAILAPTLTADNTRATTKSPALSFPAITTQAPAPAPSPTEAKVTEKAIKAREAEPEGETQVAAQSTSTVHHAVTDVATITSTVASTTTVLTTSTVYQTVFRTNTVVLDAKTTVGATSTWTITSHFPVTLTVTAVATVDPTISDPSSSTVAPALITSVASGSKATNKPLSNGAIAGIAVGATFAAIALFVVLFFWWHRHQKQKRMREAITEDYAYLGTGRSDGFGHAPVGRSNSGSGGGGGGGNTPPQLFENVYSGPPPNTARMTSVRKSSMGMTQVESNERGLPPTPWYTINTNPKTSPRTSPAASPISPTASSLPFGSEANHQQLAYGRAAHMRSESAQTAATGLSSTVVGGGNDSNRNSMRSNSGKAARLSSGGMTHTRASSLGAGSGITNVTAAADELDQGADASAGGFTNSYNPEPAEVASTSAPVMATLPDPPSPMLEPRLGPLRIMNATVPVNDSVEELPQISTEPVSHLPHPTPESSQP